LSTPVVFIIFNRPKQTALVLEAISKARPKFLLVVGDGPRHQIPGEAEKVGECREIIKSIDWPCEVLTNFSDTNLGCRERVSTGLDWAFSQVEEAIILEDDCLPSDDFFRFTTELLERYRGDERIGSISGSSPKTVSGNPSKSYYYSNFPAIWGWATWSRVWKKYSSSIPNWPGKRSQGLLGEVLATKQASYFWKTSLDDVYSNRIDTWDYQFALLQWTERYLSVIPNKNLVSNIGFGPDATHTVDRYSTFANAEIEKIGFPLIHPDKVSRDTERDLEIEFLKFTKPKFIVTLNRIFNLLPETQKRLIRKSYSLISK